MANGNGHGGARRGAGRKPGRSNRKTNKTNEIALARAGEGPMPLEVMLFVMRKHFAEERYEEAVEVATCCAAYVHPRLASTEVKGDAQAPLRVVEELVIVDGKGEA